MCAGGQGPYTRARIPLRSGAAAGRIPPQLDWRAVCHGFVGYGGAGGTRAVEQLRLVAAELQMADVRNQGMLSLYTDLENFQTFKPAAGKEGAVHKMLDQVVAWAGALKSLRGAAA